MAGALQGGLEIARVEIEPDGRIVIIAGEASTNQIREEWSDDDI